jgi:hypothetical protein
MSEQQPQQQSTMQINTPSLPKMGGAIQSIGKGWGPIGTNGAASLQIPLPISSGRGFAPGLGLNYSSNGGNSIFGIGWHLNIKVIYLRTSKGVPEYKGNDLVTGPDGDVWMPERDDNGALISRTTQQYNGMDLDDSHTVVRYWPRIENAFNLIERWSTAADPAGFWVIHGADGSVEIYGKNPRARGADTSDPQRVGAWLIEESLNTRGEHIVYEYKADEEAPTLPQLRDYRAQRYLKCVYYGNAKAHPHLYAWVADSWTKEHWHFHLLFDFGERSTALETAPDYAEDHLWLKRSDPYWNYSFGFEIGTQRLCRQVLMFHHFLEELGPTPVLVQRLLLDHRASPLGFNHLVAAHIQAYGAAKQVESRPPMEFHYNTFQLEPKRPGWTPFPDMPGLNDGQRYQLVDLYGEGMPGVLCRLDKAWYYREPLRCASGGDAVCYSDWTLLPYIPTADSSKPIHQSLTDLTGDGKLDWVIAMPGMRGYFTLGADRNWADFLPFDAFPSEFLNPQSRLADLVGNGLSDLAMIGTRSVRLYANCRSQGFADGIDVPHLAKTPDGDDDELPSLINDESEVVAFADPLGSGQQHLVRIRHDEVKVWPNLGHGRFGKGFVWSTLPFLYSEFNAAQVRLADLDGSGAADLIYLEPECLRVFMNHAGNGFAQTSIDLPWPAGVLYDRLSQVTAADLLGLGCSSLILTIPYMTPQHWRYDFVDAKPYLVNGTCNNMGASSHVTYRSSAQEWLDEKQEETAQGRTAVSKLPLAMHLVSRQTQHDEITDNTLTQCFTYRGGYYDPFDRETRGFRLLKQTDTEATAAERATAGFTAPILSLTWFHTGEKIDPPTTDYYSRDPDAVPLKPTLLQKYHFNDRALELLESPDEDTAREIARALSSQVMRTEIYAADDPEGQRVPYAVQQTRYAVRILRPKGKHQPYAVQQPLTLESISYSYEPTIVDDPLCQKTINLEWDEYGSVIHAITVNYPRRKTEQDPPPFTDPYHQTWWRNSHDIAQQKCYMTQTKARHIHQPDKEAWRLGLPYQTRGNALVLDKTALRPEQINHEDVLARSEDDGEWAKQSVLTGMSRQFYKHPVTGQTLAPGQATFEGLPAHIESAELDAIALSAYDKLKDDQGNMPFNLKEKLESREVGYKIMEPFLPEVKQAPLADPDDAKNYLWAVHRGFPTYLKADGFFNIEKYQETQSHGLTLVDYDDYSCLTTGVTLPDGCTTRILDIDYRSFLPASVEDANRNIQEARYDALGEVLVTSFHGTELGLPVGFDRLETYVPPPDRHPAIAIADPKKAIGNFASVGFSNPFSWMGHVSRTSPPSPEWQAWARREGFILPSGHFCDRARQHLAAVQTPDANEKILKEQLDAAHREPIHAVAMLADRYPGDPEMQVRVSIVSWDGFGRSLQIKQEVEPGKSWQVGDNGELILDSDGKPVEADVPRRWRVSEPVEYNNKGEKVRIYRPYFADQPRYIDDHSMRVHAFHDQQFYDAAGRPTETVLAKNMLQGNPPQMKPLRRAIWYWIWCTVAFDENDLFDPPPAKRRKKMPFP